MIIDTPYGMTHGVCLYIIVLPFDRSTFMKKKNRKMRPIKVFIALLIIVIISASSNKTEVYYAEQTADNSGNWKSKGRQCLDDIISDKEGLTDGIEGLYYSDLGKAFFAVQDITQDGIPELFISCDNTNPYWNIFMIKDDKYGCIGCMDYYDSDEHKIHESQRLTFEGYRTYVIEEEKLVLETSVGESDSENPYYRQDKDGNQTNITAEEMEAARNSFKAGLEKYGIKGVEITQENINSVLGLSSDNTENTDDGWKKLMLDAIDKCIEKYWEYHKNNTNDEFSDKSKYYSESRFNLLYIDDDEIPEIYMIPVSKIMDGHTLLYMMNNSIKEYGTGPNDCFSYISRGGKMCINHGMSLPHTEMIITIPGEMELGSGEYCTALWYEPDYPNGSDMKYKWNDVFVSEEEYNSSKAKIFSGNILEADEQKQYTYDEIMEYLQGEKKTEQETKQQDTTTDDLKADKSKTPTPTVVQENKNTAKTVDNVVIKKANVKNKSVQLSWQPVKDVDGYQIQYSQKKGFPKKNTKSKNLKNSASSTNIKKLKKGKTYYFRIRTYTKTNGKKIYGKWSDRLKIKVAKKLRKK